MKRISIYITIISISISAIFNSCDFARSIPITDNLENRYSEAKDHYPNELTYFLPDLHSGELLSFTISNPSSNRGLYPRYIHILMKYSREKADSILCNISTTNEYKFTDTCLLIIDYLPEEIKHFRNINCNPESLYDGAKSTYAPIPNFDFYKS